LPDFESVARKIVEVSADVKEGENVLILGWDHTTDLMVEIAKCCDRRGARPLISLVPESLWLQSAKSQSGPLASPPAPLLSALSECQAFIFTLGPGNPVPWSDIPQARRSAVSIWLDRRYDRSPFAAVWSRAARKASVRMVGVEATLATPQRAVRLGLDYGQWRDVMLTACEADLDSISRRARRLARLMGGRGTVRVSSPSGTKVDISLARRRVEISDGLTSRTATSKGLVTFLPAGNAEVSVDEHSAEGRVVYDVPIRVGEETVQDLEIWIHGGRVWEFTASQGKRAFEKYLKTGTNAGRLGFFGFGLNPGMRFGFTQDDKVKGAVLIGFGDNVSKSGKNDAGGNEWWGVVSGATVRIGATEVLEGGKFTE
jgi:aminopeptidase